MLSTSIGAEARAGWAAAGVPAAKFSAAPVMIALPDLMPTMRPSELTVATAESLVDQLNATLGRTTESPGRRSGQARAVATVSWPLNRMYTGVRLTCTAASCSVG